MVVSKFKAQKSTLGITYQVKYVEGDMSDAHRDACKPSFAIRRPYGDKEREITRMNRASCTVSDG